LVPEDTLYSTNFTQRPSSPNKSAKPTSAPDHTPRYNVAEVIRRSNCVLPLENMEYTMKPTNFNDRQKISQRNFAHYDVGSKFRKLNDSWRKKANGIL
jgi:hypothetical protein